MGRPLNHGLPNGSGMALMTHGAHGFWRFMALGADVMALECGSEQWMDGSGMWRGCMALWLGCLVYKVSGAGILGQITDSTRLYSNTTRAMARSRRRFESESSSDEEELPNAWEEMKKRLEPVSPAPSEEPPEVIEIADDTPSKGGFPPFQSY